MKKKQFIFISFLIILLFAVWFFFLRNPNEDITNMFNINDTSGVFKVRIDHEGESVLLIKNDITNKWTVNNKYPANKKSIKKLMQTLSECKINKPVPKNDIDSVIQIIKMYKKTVTVYGKNEKILRTWLAGPFDQNSGGTLMLNKDDNTPYIIHIPGLVNDLHNRYTSNSFYWIKSEIFSYLPHEIKSVKVTYTDEPDRSFELAINGDDVTLYAGTDKIQTNDIDKKKAGSYLSYFMNVKFSSISNLNEQSIDSLKRSELDYTVEVEDIYDNTKKTDLYLIKDKNNPEEFDPNNLYAIINNEDLVKVKFFEIDLLLKDIEYFK